jgi:hypothetical protein
MQILYKQEAIGPLPFVTYKASKEIPRLTNRVTHSQSDHQLLEAPLLKAA